MFDSVRPQRRQPTRLPGPWDSLGKSTRVGCHFLLQCIKVKMKSLSRVWLLATPWTAAYQAPPSRQEYWSGVPLPSPFLCTWYVTLGNHAAIFSLQNVFFHFLRTSISRLLIQFSSVTQSCPTFCNPMNPSMPGLPVHHHLLEFTQTHVHWVGDASCHPDISFSVVPFSSCP